MVARLGIRALIFNFFAQNAQNTEGVFFLKLKTFE
jgi:hypothetical protein